VEYCINRVVREYLFDKVTCEQTPELKEEASCVYILGKRISTKGAANAQFLGRI
jgi:hypothetical protein